MLRVNHLYKSYQTGTVTYEVLKDVSFEVKRGEFVAVMGPSGSGKTTLLNCISCFIPHDKGEILLDGKDLSKLKERQIAKVRNEKLGFVFQDFMLLDGLTVFENVCIPKVIREEPYRKMEEKAKELLAMFGIEQIKDKYPAEISGGQKQRTAVARALMNEPLLILADEPTGNLDRQNSRQIVELLKGSNRDLGQTIVIITHDEWIALEADRVVQIEDGRIVSDRRTV